MSNSLVSGQAQHFVGPDFGPNCDGYQQTTLVRRVNTHVLGIIIFDHSIPVTGSAVAQW